MNRKSKSPPSLPELLQVMARLRSPRGCPWDKEQDHQTLRFHAVEEVYELIDAIEKKDDQEMIEELGDLLLQVVFHCQLGRERKAFDFEAVTRRLVDKLIRRHPHVFGTSQAKDVDAVWAQWEQIKKAEKRGTIHDRPSALDGIPRHLPALMRAEKLIKKARKAQLLAESSSSTAKDRNASPKAVATALFEWTAYAQKRGWSAEALLRQETQKRERQYRRLESARNVRSRASAVSKAKD